MPRLILLLAVIALAWYGWQYINRQPPAERKRLIWRWGSIGLIVIAVGLVATGRMHWVGAAIAAALPALKGLFHFGLRALPFLRFWQRNSNFGPSRIRTAGLEVTLDIRTGDMSGQVFEGPHSGKALDELDENALREQLDFFKQSGERQSTLLLRAYIARRGFAGGAEGAQESFQASADVSADEAWQVLGLEPGAGREEIIKAHKRLIQKLHPDRGGSDYLASKINAAKDKLLSNGNTA